MQQCRLAVKRIKRNPTPLTSIQAKVPTSAVTALPFGKKSITFIFQENYLIRHRKAITVHAGQTAHMGHYTAAVCIETEDDDWMYLDDNLGAAG